MYIPCLECGELIEENQAHRGRHRTCANEHNKTKYAPRPPKPPTPKPPITPWEKERRKYRQNFDKLSQHARKQQPWCTDCYTTNDLTADHLPGAWQRAKTGQQLRLGLDIEVVCRRCNIRREHQRLQQHGKHTRQLDETQNPNIAIYQQIYGNHHTQGA